MVGPMRRLDPMVGDGHTDASGHQPHDDHQSPDDPLNHLLSVAKPRRSVKS